eukprot:1477031-Rhodomonas_salina.1
MDNSGRGRPWPAAPMSGSCGGKMQGPMQLTKLRMDLTTSSSNNGCASPAHHTYEIHDQPLQPESKSSSTARPILPLQLVSMG